MRLVDDLPRRYDPSVWQYLFPQSPGEASHVRSVERGSSPESPEPASPRDADRALRAADCDVWAYSLRRPPKQPVRQEAALPVVHAEALRELARDLGKILADRFFAEAIEQAEKEPE